MSALVLVPVKTDLWKKKNTCAMGVVSHSLLKVRVRVFGHVALPRGETLASANGVRSLVGSH